MDGHGWHPTVTDSGPKVILAVEYDAKGGKHYGGLVHMDIEGEFGKYALTLSDGRVLILKGALVKMLGEENPNLGFLASVLYHESRHFNNLFVGKKFLEKDELDAYNAELDAALNGNVFGLTPDEINVIKALRDQNQTAVDKKDFKSGAIPAKVEKDWEKYFVTNSINLDAEYAGLKADVEVARKAQEESAAIEDARRRQEMANRETREVMATRTRVAAAAAVEQCGFVPHFDHDTGVFDGYCTNNNSTRQFHFAEGQTLDEFRVNLMLTETCGYMYLGTYEKVDPPCNDGIAILNAHADDAAFLSAISARVTISGTNYNFTCVADKSKQIRFPLDLQQYKGLFESDIKRNKKINKQNKENAKQERKESENRRGNESRGQGQTITRPTTQPSPSCSYTDPGGGVPPLWGCPLGVNH